MCIDNDNCPVRKIQDTLVFPISSPNVDQFSKFFISGLSSERNEMLVKDPHNLKRVINKKLS